MTDYPALDRETTAQIVGRWFERVLMALLVVAVVTLTLVVLDQRDRLTVVGQQNDELVELLNGRTPIIAHIDEAVTRIECLIVEQAILLVDGVVVLLDNEDEAAVRRLRQQLEDLRAAIDTEDACKEAADAGS